MSDLVDEFRKWEATHNRDNYGRYDAYKAGFSKAVELLNNFPTALEMEDQAKNWQNLLKDTRQAQHFFEGALWMRTIVRERLGVK